MLIRRSKRILLCFLLAGFSSVLPAQKVIPVWGEDSPPYFKPHALEEYEDQCREVICAYRVVDPALTLYLPQGKANGAAVSVNLFTNPAENPDLSMLVYGLTRLTPENRMWLDRLASGS